MTWKEAHQLFATTADPKGSAEVRGIICFITGISLHNVKVPRLRQVLRHLWPSTPPPLHSRDFYLAISGFGSTKTLTNRKKRQSFHFTNSSCENRQKWTTWARNTWCEPPNCSQVNKQAVKPQPGAHKINPKTTPSICMPQQHIKVYPRYEE